MIDLILKKEANINLYIQSYNVVPISSAAGYVEIINNANTLYYINKKLNMTIQNYILNNNSNCKVSELSDRFMKSTAAYCVITYILGIGDRHLDNIMLTNDGILFHIDFGFILGFDSKPSVPCMRITDEMVDAIGGINSKNYENFKLLCTQSFNCLRRHIGLFIHMLSLIPNAIPEIQENYNYTETQLMNEIINRFLPGQTYEEAELQFNIHIEKSYNSSKHAFYDFIHHHNKQSTISNSISNVVNKATNAAKNIFNMINYK